VGIAHMVITAVDADEERARRDAAAQIAVYAATKSYAPMLEQPGFATEARAIRAAFEQHDLPGMVDAVSDELVDAMAVAGTPAQVRDGLRRFDGVVDHLIAYVPNVGVEPERIEVGALALVDALATSGAPA
jgi:alkanesulfonate monooxygenase SsuD/methylene tetrahydromethanopterin reductase-like flavin-dependent oxidoreductase (luciferase family)